jgi:N-methylhydantoinase A
VEEELRFPVPERMGPHGPLRPLEPEAAEAVVERVAAAAPESVAVVLLHSYADGAHERLLGELISRRLPGVHVSLSHQVVGTFREYERAATTEADAALSPLLALYLDRLAQSARDAGLPAPVIMQSSVGVTDAADAAAHASLTVLSGPAGGAEGARLLATEAGESDVLCFDMGGTSCDVCVIEGDEVRESAECTIGGRPLSLPMLDIHTVGAGGGSIAWRDPGGVLRVGPRSAGADPGPACYGRGGVQPTVTDADLLLGILDPDYFLGGEMALDIALAERALAHVGSEVGLDAEATARGMFDVVNSQMALALQTHVIERGEDPRAFGMVAFGGAGPVHAYEVARRLGIRTVICPPAAGVASALGFLVAPFAVDLVRTYPARISAIDWPQVAERFAEMENEARELLMRSGAAADAQLERRVDMRYAGQGYTVSVPLPSGPLDDDLVGPLRDAFGDTYEHRFGSRLQSAEPEALHWRVTARVARPDDDLAFGAARHSEMPRRPDRQTYFPETGEFISCAVYDRYSLRPGETIAGPALVQERESTAVIGPSGRAQADELGNLVVTIGAH